MNNVCDVEWTRNVSLLVAGSILIRTPRYYDFEMTIPSNFRVVFQRIISNAKSFIILSQNENTILFRFSSIKHRFYRWYRACTLALKYADSINVCLNSYHASRLSNFWIPKIIKILMFQQLFLNFLILKILKKRKNSMVFRNYSNYCSLNLRLEGESDKKIVNKQQVYKPCSLLWSKTWTINSYIDQS